MSENSRDPLLDMFVFETGQLLERLEQIIIEGEKSGICGEDTINEIFRIMHTIKGSSGMMLFDGISGLAHAVEDLFHLLRREKAPGMNFSGISDIVLESVDFIKMELRNIKNGDKPNGNAAQIINRIKNLLAETDEPYTSRESSGNEKIYKAVIYFEDGCGMENIRALAVIRSLKDLAEVVRMNPAGIEDDGSAEIIRKEGFRVWLKTCRPYDEIHDSLSRIIMLKDLELTEPDGSWQPAGITPQGDKSGGVPVNGNGRQGLISVSVAKLDRLMDIVGELVISGAMVTQNPDIRGLDIDSFRKAARQHRKIIAELQDVAMSIRMVPLSSTFRKMNRVARDMGKKLRKDVQINVIGEETEVDKNIIEHISDPLMHLIRNSMDHGIESVEERLSKGKPAVGTITLEARNAGGDVLIIVKDDGKGLDREKILARAEENGLVNKPIAGLSTKEIYSLIFLPGFSTKNTVTEFSGRGVGMDVVLRNICGVGGTVSVESEPDIGTTITLKIPLTLAIMDGITVKVGKMSCTIPVSNIKELFKDGGNEVFTDLDENEMIIIRDSCYPILRLHEIFKVETGITGIEEGIIIMVENEGRSACLFADALIGEQQVVVKALPAYISKNAGNSKGVAGCTLLGDGSISLILDIAGLFEKIMGGNREHGGNN